MKTLLPERSVERCHWPPVLCLHCSKLIRLAHSLKIEEDIEDIGEEEWIRSWSAQNLLVADNNLVIERMN